MNFVDINNYTADELINELVSDWNDRPAVAGEYILSLATAMNNIFKDKEDAFKVALLMARGQHPLPETLRCEVERARKNFLGETK